MVLKASTLVTKGKDDAIERKIESLNDSLMMSPLSRREWALVEETEARNLNMKQVSKSTEEVVKNGFRKKKKRSKAETEKLKKEMAMELDLSDLVIDSVEAQAKAIFFSLKPSDKTIKEENIQKIFTKEQFEEIYDNVLEINGIVEDEEEAKELSEDYNNFPKK